MSPVTATPPLPTVPDERGRFGDYGGRYVPEVLIPALDELAAAWAALRDDPGFRGELGALRRDFVGRPTPITHACPPVRPSSGYDIWLKREDLAHTGAHKINNALGQALLAKRLGKRAHHRRDRRRTARRRRRDGVRAARASRASSTWARRTSHRQAPNVARMKLLGAEVVPVTAGTTHPEGSRERGAPRLGGHGHEHPLHHRVGRGAAPVPAARARPAAGDRRRGASPVRRADWAATPTSSSRASAVGPTRSACSRRSSARPACELIGVEAGGRGMQLGEHCSSITQGQPGVLHGALTYLLQDADGQIVETHSISAGLDYPGVGPEHAYLHDAGLARVRERHRRGRARRVPGARAHARASCRRSSPSHVIGWLLAPAAPRGRAGPRLPVGPRRQGPRHRARGAGSTAPDGCPGGRAPGAPRRRGTLVRPLRDRRVPGCRRRPCCARSSRRRRRRDRGGDAALRPGDGRRRDPGGVPACARRRHPSVRRARDDPRRRARRSPSP